MDLRTLADIDGYERSRVEANAPLPLFLSLPPPPRLPLPLEPNAGVLRDGSVAAGNARLYIHHRRRRAAGVSHNTRHTRVRARARARVLLSRAAGVFLIPWRDLVRSVVLFAAQRESVRSFFLSFSCSLTLSLGARGQGVRGGARNDNARRVHLSDDRVIHYCRPPGSR